jgi:uncharacterized protein
MEAKATPADAQGFDGSTEKSMLRQVLTFLGLAFGITWTIWIAAKALGAHPGTGEEILAFGSAGPAIAAIFLSRSGRKKRRFGPAVRLAWFAVLWALCWFVYIESDKMRGVTPHPSALFCAIVALLAAIPAWIASGAITSDTGVWNLLRSLAVPGNWRWQAVAFLSLPAILLIPAAVVHARGGRVVWNQAHIAAGTWAAFGVLMFLRAFFFTAVFEEPGWRGYLLPCLQRKFSPLTASVLIWIPWVLWHAPLDFGGPMGRHLAVYLQQRVFALLLVSIILTWLYNRSGRNLLAVAVFHTGMNTFPLVLPYVPISLGLVVLWAAYAIVADKMWRRLGAQRFQSVSPVDQDTHAAE